MKDVFVRAGKTFIQAFLAVIILSFQNGIDVTSKEAISSVVIAAIAAGMSAINNLIINSLNKKVG